MKKTLLLVTIAALSISAAACSKKEETAPTTAEISSEAVTEACGYSPLTKVVSEEEINRILEQESGWIPVDEQIPNTDKYILVSFENFTIPDIGRYETDEDGNGAFYPGDDDKSYAKYGLFVNAWMPLPEPYRESEESHD